MTRAGAIVFLLSVAVCGCRTAENVASTSAAFITAPAHYVSRKLGGEQTTTETTDTTVYENQPVETAPPPPQPSPARSPRTITSTTHRVVAASAERNSSVNVCNVPSECDTAEFVDKFSGAVSGGKGGSRETWLCFQSLRSQRRLRRCQWLSFWE